MFFSSILYCNKYHDIVNTHQQQIILTSPVAVVVVTAPTACTSFVIAPYSLCTVPPRWHSEPESTPNFPFFVAILHFRPQFDLFPHKLFSVPVAAVGVLVVINHMHVCGY